MDPRLNGRICIFLVWLGISELMIMGTGGDYEAAGFTGYHGALWISDIMFLTFDYGKEIYSTGDSWLSGLSGLP